MTRAGALAVALGLAALCACGKYGPPVRPKPTPAHGAPSAPAPPPSPEAPDSLPAPAPPQTPDPQTVQPSSSNTEQCDDPNAPSAGAKP